MYIDMYIFFHQFFIYAQFSYVFGVSLSLSLSLAINIYIYISLLMLADLCKQCAF